MAWLIPNFAYRRRHRPQTGLRWGALAAWLLAACSLGAATLAAPEAVNVTPSGFSVLWQTGVPMTPDIDVYADAAGRTSLKGQVGVEPFPLHTGNPELTSPVAERQASADLQQLTRQMGLIYIRVTGCQPSKTYYYRLKGRDDQGKISYWPTSGSLFSVTTAQENSFVIESHQLLLNVPESGATGGVLTLSSSNAPYPLAAVVGDGASSNQVYFNLSELLSADGGGNFSPSGLQQFNVDFFGPHRLATATQNFDLNFNLSFVVAQSETNVYQTEYLVLDMGFGAVRAGDSGSVPITLEGTAPATHLGFSFQAPESHLGSLAVNGAGGPVGQATLQHTGPDQYSVSIDAAAGSTLPVNQAMAQLQFTAANVADSGFVPLTLQAATATKADGSAIPNLFGNNGSVLVVAGQPVLEAVRTGPQTVRLSLYGIPGATYRLQYVTNFSNPMTWIPAASVTLTNLYQTVGDLDTTNPFILYRAQQQ